MRVRVRLLAGTAEGELGPREAAWLAAELKALGARPVGPGEWELRRWAEPDRLRRALSFLNAEGLAEAHLEEVKRRAEAEVAGTLRVKALRWLSESEADVLRRFCVWRGGYWLISTGRASRSGLSAGEVLKALEGLPVAFDRRAVKSALAGPLKAEPAGRFALLRLPLMPEGELRELEGYLTVPYNVPKAEGGYERVELRLYRRVREGLLVPYFAVRLAGIWAEARGYRLEDGSAPPEARLGSAPGRASDRTDRSRLQGYGWNHRRLHRMPGG